MASTDVKLIGGWPSPFVMRARIVLNIKSIDYEFLQEQFGNKSELLLNSNPVHKKFPVLLHGDRPICESLVIVEYIDEVWSSGPSILPSDPYERAIARFWAAYIDDKLFPSLRASVLAPGDDAKRAAIERAEECFVLLEEAFVKISKGNDFFGGDKIDFLDIAVGSFLGWMKVSEKFNNVQFIDEVNTRNLYKWAEKFRSDPYVKNVFPETDRLAEFIKFLIARFTAPQN